MSASALHKPTAPAYQMGNRLSSLTLPNKR